MLRAISAFHLNALARVFNQNAPHQLGRYREKVGAVLTLHAFMIHQAHVGFIHQRRRLEAVAGALVLHVTARQTAELVINDGRQFFQSALFAAAPGTEDRAHVARDRLFGVWLHLHRLWAESYRRPGLRQISPMDDRFPANSAPTCTETGCAAVESKKERIDKMHFICLFGILHHSMIMLGHAQTCVHIGMLGRRLLMLSRN